MKTFHKNYIDNFYFVLYKGRKYLKVKEHFNSFVAYLDFHSTYDSLSSITTVNFICIT